MDVVETSSRLEKRHHDWIFWIVTMLKHVSRNVPRNLRDFNSQKRTAELFPDLLFGVMRCCRAYYHPTTMNLALAFSLRQRSPATSTPQRNDEVPIPGSGAMLSDDDRSNLCPFSLNEGAFEQSRWAGSTGSLSWDGDELYLLLKRTFLLKRRVLFKRTVLF